MVSNNRLSNGLLLEGHERTFSLNKQADRLEFFQMDLFHLIRFLYIAQILIGYPSNRYNPLMDNTESNELHDTAAQLIEEY